MAPPHRHTWEVTRYNPNTIQPVYRRCKSCGAIQKFKHTRWVDRGPTPRRHNDDERGT